MAWPPQELCPGSSPIPACHCPGILENDSALSCLRRISSTTSFPLHQPLCNLQHIFSPVSSGHQLHYRRKAESCGSVNYLHLCIEDERVSDTQKAVSRKQSQRGSVCWRAISNRADRALIMALCKQCSWFEMKYLKKNKVGV